MITVDLSLYDDDIIIPTKLLFPKKKNKKGDSVI